MVYRLLSFIHNGIRAILYLCTIQTVLEIQDLERRNLHTYLPNV